MRLSGFIKAHMHLTSDFHTLAMAPQDWERIGEGTWPAVRRLLKYQISPDVKPSAGPTPTPESLPSESLAFQNPP